MTFRAALKRFVAEYKGLPLALAVTGGGASLAQLATVPGASRVLDLILLPYSDGTRRLMLDATVEFLHAEGDTAAKAPKAVSAETAALLALSAGHAARRPTTFCGVTAALVTDRVRQGPNEAFVAINGKVWHVAFPKETEMDRRVPTNVDILRVVQDEAVALWTLSLIADDKSLRPELGTLGTEVAYG